MHRNKEYYMARYEVDIKVIVEADDDNEAYAVAEATAQNMVCGSILEVVMGGVADLGMAGTNDFALLDEIG